MLDLKAAADVGNPNSLANKMRNRRFALFDYLLDGLQKPVRIVDVGGTEAFWEQRGWAGRSDVDITAINHEGQPQRYRNLRTLKGDACNLWEYQDQAFDVAFSNSVIEHLFSFDHQIEMATEILRVAKAHWIQTPDFWFPMEPHFHVLGWHWLPRNVRVALIRKRQFGWRGPCPNLGLAQAAVDEVRLLSCSEMQVLFPDAQIWRERYFGLSKSIVAYAGFNRSLANDVQAPGLFRPLKGSWSGLS